MRNVVLLIFLVVNLLSNIDALSYGENLLARLDCEIRLVDDLINEIQEHYRDRPYVHSRQPLPRNYEGTLRTAGTSIGKALRLMRGIEERNRRVENEVYEANVENHGSGRKSLTDMRKMNSDESTERGNQLKWKTNFYKALSRALKEEFKDEPLIQENIHDGFIPPTWLKKGNGQ